MTLAVCAAPRVPAPVLCGARVAQCTGEAAAIRMPRLSSTPFASAYRVLASFPSSAFSWIRDSNHLLSVNISGNSSRHRSFSIFNRKLL